MIFVSSIEFSFFSPLKLGMHEGRVITCKRKSPTCKRKNSSSSLEKKRMPGRRTKRAGVNGGPSRRRRNSSSSTDGSSMVSFSIMLPIVMEEKKLKLPMAFGRSHGRKMGVTAQLHLPNGGVWNVGVSKGARVEDIWLDEGWGSFMEENSVLLHYFLTFNYVGKSKFHVRIYDLTTCEIPYPAIHAPTSNNNEMEDEDEDDDEDDPSVVFIRSTKVEDDDDDEVDDAVDGAQELHGEEEQRAMVNELEALEIWVSYKFLSTFRKMSGGSKEALRKAIRNKFEEGPSFIVIIPTANGRHNLNVPTGFVNRNLAGGGEAVTLKEVSGRGEWVVEAGFSDYGRFRLLGDEWRKFYDENKLEAGDVCLFQLLPGENVEFVVSIYRGSPFTA